jgi:hydroxymethylpyrimidine kinase/phosphomethylpyrimidine kinase/thiamine-phosphate diphosphorylase
VKAVVWCIAGTDSSGGAGLSADQRAVEAFEGVHFCGIVAAVTAQNSRAVAQVTPMPVALLDAQLQALAQDMPPTVLKTGLLGGPEQVRCVAVWVDRLRAEHPGLALVVDPVLAASSGAVFADEATLAAYREWLLPRATLVTPNQHEASLLLGNAARQRDVPALGRALREAGAQAVCVTGGDSDHGAGSLVLDWLDSAHARGWLALPRIDTRHTHGTGCTFASSAAAALAQGFVPADAVVLAKMATAQALRHGHAAGAGAGQVGSARGFHAEPALLPQMSWDEAPAFAPMPPATARSALPLGLYAIVDSAEQARAVLAAGVRTMQLRIKQPDHADTAWWARLQSAVRSTAQACRAAGARLFVNDHWVLAIEVGAHGVHLGQEDLQALGDADRAALAASGLALGVSSHSLWELARARSLAPAYIACGPVWPTLTKAMPWVPQGLDNLRWWCAMAGVPVVAIGGVLSPAQITQAAACGADGVCVVRMLGPNPGDTVPAMRAALAQATPPVGASGGWPHPSLSGRLEAPR